MDEADRQDVEDLRREIVRLVLKELADNPGEPVPVQLEGPGLDELKSKIERLLQPLALQVTELTELVTTLKSDFAASASTFSGDVASLKTQISGIQIAAAEDRQEVRRIAGEMPALIGATRGDQSRISTAGTVGAQPPELEPVGDGGTPPYRNVRDNIPPPPDPSNDGADLLLWWYENRLFIAALVAGLLVLAFVVYRYQIAPFEDPLPNSQARTGGEESPEVLADNEAENLLNAPEVNGQLRQEDQKDAGALLKAPDPTNVRSSSDGSPGNGEAAPKTRPKSD